MSFSKTSNSGLDGVVGRGLPNRGFTCYLGSAFHAIIPFTQLGLFLVQHYNNNREVYNLGENDLLRKFIKLIRKLGNKEIDVNVWTQLVDEFFSSFFGSSLSKDTFKRFEYHDPSEFLCRFFEFVDKCLVQIEIRKLDVMGGRNLYEALKTCEERFSIVSSSFKSVVKRSTTCCGDPCHQLIEFETRMQLSLPIEGCQKLEDCLDKFFSVECTEDRRFCDICNAPRRKKIVYSVDSLSDNLIINLNRIKVNFRIFNSLNNKLNHFSFVVFRKFAY
jgi:ubiquitin C-terminal hydrolase